MSQLPSYKTLKNFFVLEGLDGSGKTTVMKELQVLLPQARLEREPTHSLLGNNLKSLINDGQDLLSEESLLFLFSADRWEHVFGKNGLAHKKPEDIIVCDRYLFSSLAYQGNCSKTLELAKELNRFFPLPELVFYLDISPEVALRRISARNEVLSHYEHKEKLYEIRNNYLQIFQDFQNNCPVRIISLDAQEKPKVLANKIARSILKLKEESL